MEITREQAKVLVDGLCDAVDYQEELKNDLLYERSEGQEVPDSKIQACDDYLESYREILPALTDASAGR